MIAFFSILLAVVLLGITVYGLHRYQTMEVEYTVDRSMPLPPLESDELSAVEPEQSDPDQTSAKPPAARSTTVDASSADKPKQTSVSGKADPSQKKTASQTWLQQVAELKKTEQLDAAMTICREEFPLWGAYNQACIIERLKLKQAGNNAVEEQAFLERLYRLAAIAELLHDKSDGTDPVPLSQLRELDLAHLDELRFPYQTLGYAHLRLVRKSDIKLMLSHWGRPDQHQLPRDYHRDWWQQTLEA